MRSLWFGKNNRSNNVLHIETEHGIINIRVNLRDTKGNEVTSIEVLTGRDCELDGHVNTRIVKERKCD